MGQQAPHIRYSKKGKVFTAGRGTAKFFAVTTTHPLIGNVMHSMVVNKGRVQSMRVGKSLVKRIEGSGKSNFARKDYATDASRKNVARIAWFIRHNTR